MDQKKQTPPPDENITSSGSNAFEDLTSHETNAAPLAGEEADHFYESQIDRTEFVQNFKVSIDEKEPANGRPNPLAHLHKSVKARQQAAKAGEEETAVKKKKRKIIISNPKALALCVVLVISIASSLYLLSCINDVLALMGSDTKTSVTIPENASQKEILQILQENDLINHPHFCNFFVNTIFTLRNRGTDKKATDVKYLNAVSYTHLTLPTICSV